MNSKEVIVYFGDRNAAPMGQHGTGRGPLSVGYLRVDDAVPQGEGPITAAPVPGRP